MVNHHRLSWWLTGIRPHWHESCCRRRALGRLIAWEIQRLHSAACSRPWVPAFSRSPNWHWFLEVRDSRPRRDATVFLDLRVRPGHWSILLIVRQMKPKSPNKPDPASPSMTLQLHIESLGGRVADLERYCRQFTHHIYGKYIRQPHRSQRKSASGR